MIRDVTFNVSETLLWLSSAHESKGRTHGSHVCRPLISPTGMPEQSYTIGTILRVFQSVYFSVILNNGGFRPSTIYSLYIVIVQHKCSDEECVLIRRIFDFQPPIKVDDKAIRTAQLLQSSIFNCNTLKGTRPYWAFRCKEQ